MDRIYFDYKIFSYGSAVNLNDIIEVTANMNEFLDKEGERLDCQLLNLLLVIFVQDQPWP